MTTNNNYRTASLLTLFLLAGMSPSVHAEDIRVHADLTYTEANPDWKPYPNGEGFSVYGELWAELGVFGAYRYTDAELIPSGAVSGGTINDWQSLDAGYRYGWHQDWQLEARLSYQQNERDLGTRTRKESGLGYELGGAVELIDRLNLRLNIGTIDVEISDWVLRSELQFDFNDRLFAIARLRDYADWDFTYYEAGFGVKF